MKLSFRLFAIASVLCLAANVTNADEKGVNPKVREIVGAVSEARIQAIIEKLAAFGTRNTMSVQDDPTRGVGAARQWIFDQLKSYSPRLEVRFDKWKVKKQGQRIFKDVDLWNVVAVLPGKTMPETQVWVTGHYDSLNLGTPAGPSADDPPAAVGERPVQSNWEKNTDLPAPGACDGGSGTAAVMELARIMSQYEFDKTLVFVAFAGEEQGLFGSTLEAAKAKKDATAVEAVLNNDIIGSESGGDGRVGNTAVSVYTDEIMDSPSQQLGRFIQEAGERYVPSMKVNMMFMQDRLGRGGDHAPFQLEGFAAVRLSSPFENYTNQHSGTDTLANMSVPLTARIAKVNAAAAASLALAPKAPLVTAAPRAAAANAAPAAAPAANAPPRVATPTISRGQSRYDALLRWRYTGPDAGLKGFAIVIRPTTSANWEQEIFVGKVTEYTLKGVSIDDARFGVKAFGADGSESLVTPYVYPARRKTEIQVVE
jgi:hypothetical protein